jgi:hypothetical protein
MQLLSRKYADLYSWSHAYGDQVLCHTDGANSCLIEWDGFDAEMMSDTDRANTWSTLYTILQMLGTEYCAEFHLWREYDDTLAQDYLQRGQDMVRGQQLGQYLRQAMAEHLAPYGIRNRVGLVLTRLPRPRLALGAKRQLVRQGEDAEMLLTHAEHITARLPGARVVSKDQYINRIVQSFDRESFLGGAKLAIDPRFSIAEQVLREAPRVVDRRIVMGERHSKVLLVHLYPDADAAWFALLATANIAMHVSQVVIPVDTKQSLKASERASDLAEGSMGKRGRSVASQTLNDLANFQQYVSGNNLSIFKNCYIIHLHGERDELTEQSRYLSDWINSNGGQVRDADYVQLPYFRAAQPGQGYLSPMFRPDHTWQVANMAPVQVYRTGEPQPESLRLGQSGALIGFDMSAQKVPHSFTVAMTGSGKGVDKVATIAETFPYGIDWYICEIGGSYKWVVEGFGGTYSKVDPSETVVNPLPPFAIADIHKPLPLNATIAGGTVNALSFLLTDGLTDMPVHHAAAAQSALQLLYAVPDAKREAPSLPDYLRELEAASRELESDLQRTAAKAMAQNLSSFLDTTEGRIFAREDNLVLSEGITGVDLKEVDRASPKLLKFYLVFLALRFNHLAFARRNPARVLLDEMHKFVAIAPDVTGRLISELARMGRKDAAAIDLVTQGIAEIDIIEDEVLNSMPLRSLLYRADGWDKIAGRIAMPPGPLAMWKKYPYPMNFDWRPAMRSVGEDYYNLHLSFPHPMLDLAATSPEDLDLKDAIGLTIKDPLARLKEFRLRKTRK